MVDVGILGWEGRGGEGRRMGEERGGEGNGGRRGGGIRKVFFRIFSGTRVCF